MSAVPTRGNRTGRSIAVLTYLEKQTRPRNVREIINAVGGDVNCTLMYGTLSTLQRQGKLLVKKIAGNNMFRIAPGAMINRVTGARIDQPTVPAKVAARERADARRQAALQAAQAKAQAKQQAKAEAKAAREQKRAQPARRGATPPPPSAKAQLTAALATKVTNTQRLTVANAHGGAYLAVKQLASAQIAADIAAFEAAGGKVQRLDMHACSRPLNGDYRDTFTINSSNRGQYRATAMRALPANNVDIPDDDTDD